MQVVVEGRIAAVGGPVLPTHLRVNDRLALWSDRVLGQAVRQRLPRRIPTRERRAFKSQSAWSGLPNG
ncbi:hypothetical protein HQO12_17005 [Rhodococcus fascians]|uniref:hypothetical protein n=1 Tax=Rhodococcoides fascians TaxID=1828 RepID=UPI00195F95D6|nr:hypothetical protein [Rhodococcus fascians]MBM7244037.1 hypothetical protein [Rhodococcus fascians]MBY3810605.1 hypothetical protein [Rhodococcus fascians]MBY3841772.1 hypothetical protein [Rhodococcus fascians]MBY3850169.1 hypothetical protein [Rhodococcus fascians]MBY3854428.1 hypothetical protein [Rhodococcus fascians]